MQTQMSTSRPSLVALDRARRTIRAKRRTGLDKLRLGAHKAAAAGRDAAMAEIFEGTVRGFESGAGGSKNPRNPLDGK